MELNIIKKGSIKIAKLSSSKTMLTSVQDAIDLLGNASYQGADGVIVEEPNFNPNFFDLKTGIAWEILQKYTNYRMKFAIVGDFKKYQSKALNAFIVECNRGNYIFFVSDLDSAIERILE